MTTVLAVTLAIVFILTAVFAFLPLPRRGMYIALWGVRGGLLIALLGAFLQPALRCDRLAGRDAAVGVIIDNSLSMQLFNAPDVLGTVSAIARQSRRSAVKTYFTTFGDSLRRTADPTQCVFNETKSLLPTAWHDPVFSGASRILIVSDGNWSNPSIPRDVFSDKECFFISLTKTRSHPFTDLQPLVREIESTPDSTPSIPVHISGWTKAPQRFVVTLRRADMIAATRTITADSGYFSDTVQLPVRTAAPGRHRYAISLRDSDDPAGSVLSSTVIHTVIPARFTVYRHAPVPDLDSRFLSLALDGSVYWKQVTDPKQADLLLLQTWDAQAESLLQAIKPAGIVLLWGCLPCAAVTVPISPGEWFPRYIRRPDSPLPFDENTPLPLPAGIIACATTADAQPVPVFSFVRVAGPAPDTLTILSQTRLRQRTALMVHAQQTWRWDFWTRPFNTAESEYPFSRYVLEEARQLVIRNIANTVLLYTHETPPRANQPLRIRIMLPAPTTQSSASQIQLRLLPAAPAPAFDTIITVMPGYDRYLDAVTPPMPQGKVVCSAQLRTGRKDPAGDIDTLDILPDNSELRVIDQNTLLLSQVAREIDPRDTAGIAALFTADQNIPQRTISRTIQIQPTVELLILIFALLCFEWVARRKMRLD